MPLLRTTAVLTAIEDELIEEPLWQRLMANAVVMALLTGGALRVYRTVILQYGWSNSWLWVGGTFLGQAAILFLLVTLHLGNFHAKSWAWRAPLFVVLGCPAQHQHERQLPQRWRRMICNSGSTLMLSPLETLLRADPPALKSVTPTSPKSIRRLSR